MNWEKGTLQKLFVNYCFKDKYGSHFCIELWLTIKNRFVTTTLSARIININTKTGYSWEKSHAVHLMGHQAGVMYNIIFIMSCYNRVKSLMLNAIDVNYSIWIHSKKNARNTPKDMTQLFFFMTMLDYMLQNKWKKFWRHFDGMLYPIRPIHQTLPLQITICFGWCNIVFLSSTSIILKISKNCSMDHFERTQIFLPLFVIRKVGKGCSFRWTILW